MSNKNTPTYNMLGYFCILLLGAICRVDLEIKKSLLDYNFGNTLVVDLEIKKSLLDYNFGNTLVVDLEIKKSLLDYNFGNTLVVRTDDLIIIE